MNFNKQSYGNFSLLCLKCIHAGIDPTIKKATLENTICFLLQLKLNYIYGLHSL